MTSIIKEWLKKYIYRIVASKLMYSNDLQSSVGISTLINHKNVDMFIYAISSLSYYSGVYFKVFAMEDGTLTKMDTKKLKEKFNIKIVGTHKADEIIAKRFIRMKNFLNYRLDKLTPVTKRKIDALLLCPFKKFIYLEPDILFFNKPKSIVNWINQSKDEFLILEHDRGFLKSFEREDMEYSVRAMIKKYVFPTVSLGYNSGLLCIPNKNLLDVRVLDKIFRFFSTIGYSNAFCAEETALSILLKKLNYQLLPSKKYVCPTNADEYGIAKSAGPTMIHYIYDSKGFIINDSLVVAFKSLLLGTY